MAHFIKEVDIDQYTYNIEWSKELNMHISTCGEFPLLKSEGSSPEIALSKIKKLIAETVEWIVDKKQQLPEPLYLKQFHKKTNDIFEAEDKDVLTGLYNRNYCQKVFKEHAETGTPFVFIYFDLDGFKMINDALNHETGDEILQVLSNSLRDMLEDEVYLFRVGGDEFACIVSEKISTISAEECIDKLLAVCNERFYLETVFVDITISIGVVHYPKNIADVKNVFKVAEFVMQEAKNNYKNSVCFFEEELKNKLEAKVLMESNLASALRKNELFLVYQPIIQPDIEDSISFEALLRWNSEDLGFVSPAEFIPEAEDTGQIYTIGFFVMDKAMEQLAKLEKKSDKEINVSINISTLQLKEDDFIETVQQLIDKHEVSPESIIFEFTESIFIENNESMKKTIENIRNLGINIAIDDFGTGYSAFTYLKNLNIDALKIDKTFIDELGKSSWVDALVEAIINIGHTLGMKIIAEGIETEEQLNILKAWQCDGIQGYYYSKPLPEDELDKYL